MHDKEHDNITAVDENDNLIGYFQMFDAIEKGYIRRASRAYVFNESGKVLIQRRSANVLKPLMLDPSLGGHVDEGESYFEAAEREMFEELGIRHSEFPLREVVKPYLGEGFYSAMYKVIVPDDFEINFDPGEVAEVFWLKPEEVDKLIHEQSDECTKSLVNSWLKLRDKLIST